MTQAMIKCSGLVYTGSEHGYAECQMMPSRVYWLANGEPRRLCTECVKRYAESVPVTTNPRDE